MIPALTLGAAALAVLAGAPATAATATLTHRVSVSQIELTGGYGPAIVGFTDGSLVPVTALGPSEILDIGADSTAGRYAAYEVSFAANWDQRQNYSFQTLAGNAVLAASGALLVSMNSTWYNHVGGLGGAPATQQYTSRNWQAFEFRVDEATPYTFSGQTIGGQRLQMFQWLLNDWISVPNLGPGEGESFGSSGVLAAGQYLLRNAPSPIVRTQTAVTTNQWAYALTLHGAVAAVPEPATVASMLAGLACLGAIGLRRRRAGPV